MTPKIDRPVALVTGGGSGIGRAIARRLATDGFAVGVNDLPSQQNALDQLVAELRELGAAAVALAGDICDPAAVDACVAVCVEDLGDLRVMVANAGVIQVQSLVDTTLDDWNRLMAVNVQGTLLCFQAAARQMIRQGRGGKIIGAASVSSYRPTPMLGAYTVSKFAVRGLVQSAAAEWARHGITVNAYCPGMVETPMWDEIDRGLAALQGKDPGSVKERAGSRIPIGRWEQPEDVAGLVSYLASDDSDYMTGQSLLIDGGLHYS